MGFPIFVGVVLLLDSSIEELPKVVPDGVTVELRVVDFSMSGLQNHFFEAFRYESSFIHQSEQSADSARAGSKEGLYSFYLVGYNLSEFVQRLLIYLEVVHKLFVGFSLKATVNLVQTVLIVKDKEEGKLSLGAFPHISEPLDAANFVEIVHVLDEQISDLQFGFLTLLIVSHILAEVNETAGHVVDFSSCCFFLFLI